MATGQGAAIVKKPGSVHLAAPPHPVQVERAVPFFAPPARTGRAVLWRFKATVRSTPVVDLLERDRARASTRALPARPSGAASADMSPNIPRPGATAEHVAEGAEDVLDVVVTLPAEPEARAALEGRVPNWS